MIELSEFLKICNSIYDEIQVVELHSFQPLIELVEQKNENAFIKQLMGLQAKNNINRIRKYKYSYGLFSDSWYPLIEENYKKNTQFEKWLYLQEQLLDKWKWILKELAKEKLQVVFFKTEYHSYFEEDEHEILIIYCIKENGDNINEQ